jgi:hypothetical protein
MVSGVFEQWIDIFEKGERSINREHNRWGHEYLNNGHKSRKREDLSLTGVFEKGERTKKERISIKNDPNSNKSR